MKHMVHFKTKITINLFYTEYNLKRLSKLTFKSLILTLTLKPEVHTGQERRGREETERDLIFHLRRDNSTILHSEDCSERVKE